MLIPVSKSIAQSNTILTKLNVRHLSLEVGQSVQISRIFTQKDVEIFANLTGDNNPLHLDAQYAQKSMFGKCIVHGMLINGIFSKLMGTELPGHGTIYKSQFIKFKSPLYINEKFTCIVQIEKMEGRNISLSTRCLADERDKKLICDGTAHVFFDSSNENL